jgi:hypothetical protein
MITLAMDGENVLCQLDANCSNPHEGRSTILGGLLLQCAVRVVQDNFLIGKNCELFD